ncbi:MAG TPA: DUF3795 domain-containing protein [Acidobacteriota bacterium]|nr:DUF3795 domain-containing protein [Acidobacteriota bacterium]
MSGLIAYCGLNCRTCQIYLATRVSDKEQQIRMKTDIARLCREHYGLEYEPEDITDCDGCAQGGRLFSGCSVCLIRKCAVEKSVENCAYCDEYVCANLAAHFSSEPTAKTRLDEIRSGIRWKTAGSVTQ